MTTTHEPAFNDFWESSSLHQLNAPAFGARVLGFDEGDRGVDAFAGPAPGVPLGRVRDRFQRQLAARRSSRSFAETPLRAVVVDRLLAAVGSNADGRHLVPSAGGLSSVHTFVIGHRVAGPCDGRVVRYHAATHSVHDMGPAPATDEIRRLFQLDCDGEPQLVMVFVANLESVMRKYGPRGARFVCQEAGHAAQNVSLRLAHDHMVGYVLGGALDREVLSMLGLAHLDAVVAGAIACGR